MGSRRKSGPEVAQHPADDDLLEISPFAGDLDTALAARPPRSVKPSLTVYLGAGVLLVAGFVAGIQADKHWGGGGSSSAAGSGLPTRSASRTGSRFGGFGGFGGAGGAQGSGGGATVGTVKLVDGTTVYVDTGGGGIVAVRTDGSTKINVTKSGTLKDVPPGSAVVVQGTPGSDGSITARTILQGGLGVRQAGG